jgi:hypothetical protein
MKIEWVIQSNEVKFYVTGFYVSQDIIFISFYRHIAEISAELYKFYRQTNWHLERRIELLESELIKKN